MYRWCSFCNSYIGRKQPYQNYELTHGICTPCFDNQINKSQKVDSTAFDKVNNFYKSFRKDVVSSTLPEIDTFILKAQKLHIKPSDLLVGIVQPLLYEIGTRYENGETTIFEEHLFSKFTDKLLISIFKQYKLDLEKDVHIDVWIFAADGEYHEFGPRFLETFLRQHGLKAKAVTPGLPIQEIYNKALNCNPKVICISTSLSEQFKNLITKLTIFNNWPHLVKPFFILGGQGADSNVKLPLNNAIVHTDELLSFLNIVNEKVLKFKAAG